MVLLIKILLAALPGMVAGLSPTATVKNGTYEGKYVASYDQDLFLGIPFAQPPVGELRFQNPRSLNSTFGTRNATEYAYSCVGYGNSAAWPHTLSEDCLTLNIVRPAKSGQSQDDELLPVGFFTHGGGWSMDYSANGVYNLSFIVEESVKMGKPFIAVSADYRLSFWGFMASQDILDAGVANLGLKDQRISAVGCDSSSDKLACLRTVLFDRLNATISNVTGSFYPIVDGDIIPDLPSVLLDAGEFIRTPILLGTNADEATMFAGTGASTDEDMASLIQSSGLDANTTEILMALYPDIDSLGLPANYHVPPDGPVGKQYKRSVALLTDQMFLSWRRLRTDAWSKYGAPAYSYLFESPMSSKSHRGTSHFTEIGYVFYNRIGLGYAASQSPLTNATQDVLDLARLTTRMWISFITDLDPNHHGVSGIDHWPVYNATGGYGQNFYLHPTNGGVRPDTFRLAGTTFMNSVAREQYGR